MQKAGWILASLCALSTSDCATDERVQPADAGAADATAAEPPPPTWPAEARACSGKHGLLRGKSTQSLMAAGLSRSFIYYAPSTLAPDSPAPEAPEVKQVQGGSCEYCQGCPADGQVAPCSFDVPMTAMRGDLYIGHAWSGGSEEALGELRHSRNGKRERAQLELLQTARLVVVSRMPQRFAWITLACASCASAAQGVAPRACAPDERVADAGNVAERLGYPADARLLILHADDLGMTHGTNVATLHALEAGLIQSASILVTSPWLPEVADWARQHPEHDLGIHLALTSEWPAYRFRPVSGAHAVPSLVDQLGYLPQTQAEVEARATPVDVQRELSAQIELAYASGITITHLDSHMLALFWKRDLFAAYVQVGTRYGLPMLLPDQNVVRTHQLELNARLRLVDQIIGITPDVPHTAWRDWYERTLSQLGPGVYEVLLHLSADDAEMLAATEHIDAWGAAFRARDLAVISSAEFQAFVRDQGFKLVTWRQLARALPQGCRGPLTSRTQHMP